MSYGWNRDQSAADLANSFLTSVGQELHGSNDNAYPPPPPHDAQNHYGDSYHGGNEDYRRDIEQSSRRGGGDSHRRHSSRERYRERSRERQSSSRRRRSSRDRRERSPRDRSSHHRSSRNNDDSGRDYRRSRRRTPSPPPLSHRRRSRSRSRRSRSRSHRRNRDEDTVIPLSKRVRKLHNWDMAPAGMEGMSAEQVKMTGLFPLPGQVVGTRTPQSFQPPPAHNDGNNNNNGGHSRMVRTYPHQQLHLQPQQQQYNNNSYHHPHLQTGSEGAAAAAAAAASATLARQAKRLYVGQIPFGIEEKPMADFFNETMKQMNLADTTPVTAVQINHDKNYAFVEFQTPEQATLAMAFDGIMFQGQTLKIRRPKDYQPPVDGEYNDIVQLPGVVSTNVPDTPNKIFIGGLPVYLNEDQVIELLKSFGELRAFNLVKDPTNGTSKGFAFCEYMDGNVTDLACQGLNNMELGDRKLVVQRASVGAKHGMVAGAGGPGGPGGPGGEFNPVPTAGGDFLPVQGAREDDATRVLQLMNMVTPDELEDDEEYQDIWEDIAEECSKFGTIIDMKIPRPNKEQPVPGCGLIFVRFETKDQTLVALRALAGRKFSDRTVVATFIDEDDYLADNF